MRRVWLLSRQQASRRQWDKAVLLKGDVATLMLGMMVRSTGAGGEGECGFTDWFETVVLLDLLSVFIDQLLRLKVVVITRQRAKSLSPESPSAGAPGLLPGIRTTKSVKLLIRNMIAPLRWWKNLSDR